MIYRQDVLEAIAEINAVWRKPEVQCYLMALLLAAQFQGEIYYDHNHCITKIDGVFYDKSGVVFIEDMDTEFLHLEKAQFGIHIKKTLIDGLIDKHKP